VANSDNKTFQEYMAEGMENMTKTAFPQLSKFMDFSREKMKNEDKASDSISSSEDDIGTPNKRRRKSASADMIGGEMVLDSLTAIDERLKVQSIVLVSQLEQQTITNQLLGRLAAGGGGFGAGGGGSGGGSGGGVADAALAAAGGASIINWLKTAGKAVLGGAASLLMSPGGALAAGGAAGVAAAETIRRTDHNEDVSPNAPNKTGSDLQAEIEILKADIEREKQHLALNPTDATIIAILKKLEEKLDKDLAKDQMSDAAVPATPQHNWGPWHAGGTPTGPIINSPADTPTSVSKSGGNNMPPLHSGYVPDALPQGTNPLDIIRHGGGTPAGGGSGTPGVPRGAFRAGGGGRTGINEDTVNKGIMLRDHLMKEYGMTKEQATGFAGTLAYESGNFHSLQEGAPVSGRGGYGWAQWTGTRRTEFEENAKENNLDPSSDAAQISMIDRELKGKYKHALEAIKRTNTVEDASKATLVGYEGMPDTAAIRAMGGKPATRQHIQRAVDLDAAIRRREEGGRGAGGAGPGPDFKPPKDTGEVLDHIAKARSLGLVNGEECVALAAGAVGVRLDKQHGVGSQVSDWRRGDAADTGKLKPGTPVATFHKRDGTIGDRYAEGSATGGDPGADLDHAGVIVGYDKDGKGMTIADQWGGHTRGGRTWGGSGPGHTTHVTNDGMVTRADGSTYYSREHDIHRYFGINTERGPLGGRNNPNTPFVDPHRGPSGPAHSAARSHRPEEGRDTAADALDLKKYRSDMDDYSERQRQYNRYNFRDTQKTTAAQLVHNSNTEAVNAAAQAKHAASVNIHQMHASTGGAHSLTPAGKSDRLSDRDVGSANPPPQRLSELFTSGPSAKTWG
jgi:hypothetical protein